MSMPTLLDIAKRNGSDAVVGIIDEASKATPEVLALPARTIPGQNYKTNVRVALPSAGFRSANNGVDASTSRYEQRLVDTYILNPRWECDKAIADRAIDGPAAYIFDEAVAMLSAGMLQCARNFYYGTNTTYSGDALGFPGLIDAYDSTNMVVDAGGTTATTGSSLWAVRIGRKDVQWVWGEEGQLEMADPRVESITGENSKRLTAYVQELLAYPGLQIGSVNSVGRIKKLTADSGKGLTDALISSLLAKFPVGRGPNVMFCTRRSLAQLQQSRTATTPTGADAEWPRYIVGMNGEQIPIFATEALSDVEALTL